MTTWWRRFGRGDAINSIVIAAVAALPFIAGFVTVSPVLRDRVGLLTAFNALSVCAVVATLLLARFVNARLVRPEWRPLATIAAFQLAAIVRAVTITALLVQAGFASVGEIWWRLFGAQSSVFVTAIVVSSLVTMARDLSESNRRLAASLESLTAARAQLESHVTQHERTLVASIRSQLEAALASLTGTNAAHDAEQLQTLIDDVVRPISHRLGRELRSSAEAVVGPAITPIDWSRLLRHLLSTNPVHPRWTTVWFAIAAIQFFAVTFGAGFIAPYLIAVACFAAWFAGGRWLWNRVTVGVPLVPRALVFTSIPAALPIVIDVILQGLFDVVLLTPQLIAAQTLWFAIVTWSVSLVIAARTMLRQTNAQLLDAERTLSRQLATESARARHVGEAVARVLHGPVQLAIAAALRRVQSMADGRALDAAELRQIRHPIEQSLAMLDRTTLSDPQAALALDELVELWSGVVQIDVALSPTTSAALDECPATASAVIELLRELVSNAIRHGRARTITVDVALDTASSDIMLRVTNDGHPVPDDAAWGIGTRLLEGMSVRWSRENRDGAVVVQAAVPLDASAAPA